MISIFGQYQEFFHSLPTKLCGRARVFLCFLSLWRILKAIHSNCDLFIKLYIKQKKISRLC